MECGKKGMQMTDEQLGRRCEMGGRMKRQRKCVTSTEEEEKEKNVKEKGINIFSICPSG